MRKGMKGKERMRGEGNGWERRGKVGGIVKRGMKRKIRMEGEEEEED